MRIDWGTVFNKGDEEKNAREKGFLREELCERLMDDGYCANRAGGMKLIALAIQTKLIRVDIGDENGKRERLWLMETATQTSTVSSEPSRVQQQCSDVQSKQSVGMDVSSRIEVEQTAQITTKAIASNPCNDAGDITKEDDDEFELSEEQRLVIRLIEEGENVFVSGSAGSGKSFLLKRIMEREALKWRGQDYRSKVVCTSLTGLASCNIGGVTLHSFAGIGIASGATAEELMMRVSDNRAALRRWRAVELLLIDEVSMLDADLFEKLDYIARTSRNSTKPFGGIQLCLSGDFFQLPPVGLGKDESIRFCFESPKWDQVITRNVILRMSFRQTEDALRSFLSDFRKGVVQREFLRTLCERPLPSLLNQERDAGSSCSSLEQQDMLIVPTTLFARNVNVDHMNEQRLKALGATIRTYQAYDWYRDPTPENRIRHERTMMNAAPQTLSLAVGAQVILTKNLSKTTGLVNGSRGVVVGFERPDISPMLDNPERFSSELCARIDPEELLPIVLFAGTKTATILSRAEFETCEGFRDAVVKVASRCAIPLRLAWALSIHKSQGQTIDMLHVDLSGVFEYGQAFVALSRASSLNGLWVSGYHDRMPLAHPQVVQFYQSLQNKMKSGNISFDSKATTRRQQRPCIRIHDHDEEEDDTVAWLPRNKRTHVDQSGC